MSRDIDAGEGRSGSYFANKFNALGESVKRGSVGAIRELDDAQIEIYQQMSPAQKFYQAASLKNQGNMVCKINDPEQKNNDDLSAEMSRFCKRCFCSNVVESTTII